jgi:cytochrome c
MNVPIKHILTLTFCLALIGPALAAGGEDLANAKGCFSCHDVNAENFGPSFKDIARRFSGLSNSKRMLAREVQVGTDTSSAAVIHHWGNMKMPRESDRVPVTQEEAEQLVDYILGVK